MHVLSFLEAESGFVYLSAHLGLQLARSLFSSSGGGFYALGSYLLFHYTAGKFFSLWGNGLVDWDFTSLEVGV